MRGIRSFIKCKIKNLVTFAFSLYSVASWKGYFTSFYFTSQISLLHKELCLIFQSQFKSEEWITIFTSQYATQPFSTTAASKLQCSHGTAPPLTHSGAQKSLRKCKQFLIGVYNRVLPRSQDFILQDKFSKPYQD